MTDVNLVIEILADFLIGNLFRGFVVMCNEIEHGIQVVLLRGLRQAVVCMSDMKRSRNGVLPRFRILERAHS